MIHPYLKVVDEVPINNVAVVMLATSVQFNEFIRPVCLWTFNNDLSFIQKFQMFAVGYGRDENGIVSNVRKHAKVVLTDQNECQEKYHDLKMFFRESKAFCVTGTENESPCEFDECLFVKFNEKWYLRGIALRRFYYSDKSCGVGNSFPSLYQDIAKNSKWIQTKLKKKTKFFSSNYN
jgi:dynein heavy chain